MTNKTDPLSGSVKVYTISEITSLIKARIEGMLPPVWVEGEMSNFHRHQSGHLYFTLKDERSQLKGVMFRSDARKLVFELKDGQLLICHGRFNVYEPRGEYQLVIDRIEPKGTGALQLAFEQLKEKLKKEGLFDPAHKKKLPLLPKKIGVVTSPRGAAIVDILKTLERRFARLHIMIYPVKVQGEGAAEEIVEGIQTLGSRPDMDVIIVGRGGGSLEDLWAFNMEAVARAIFHCPVPLISAVGHEVDFTIADFVADIRASTPSAAAEMVCEKEQAFFDRIDGFETRLKHQLRFTVQDNKSRVLKLIHHQAFQNFKLHLLNVQQKIDDWETRAWNVIREERHRITKNKSLALLHEQKIINNMKNFIRSRKAEWEKITVELNGLSPLNILKKGYTVCWKPETGIPVREIEEISEGEKLAVSFFKGEFGCTVSQVDREKTIESRMNGKDE